MVNEDKREGFGQKFLEKVVLPKHKKPAPNYDGYVVIGAGLPRTGTHSMQAALEQLLKGPCHHMLEVFEGGNNELWHWESVLEGSTTDEDWKEFLEGPGRGFRSGVDYPISHHYQTLMRLFPKAKVVLTVRDPERWYDSVKNTIFQNVDLSQGTTGTFIKLIGMSKVHNMCIRLSQQGPPVTRYGLFDSIARGKGESIRFYNDWIQHVKDTVPKDRLLVFEVKEGWEPLCKFLNVPEPNEPFPRVNDTPSMLRNFKKIRIISYTVIWGIPILVGMMAIVAILKTVGVI